MSNRHELGNMIFNLEERKNIEEVKFTKSAVKEVLCYLKELYEIKNNEHEEDRRVADLETKLAESETEIKSLSDEISSLEQDLTHYKGEVFNLKDQLAEKENENLILYSTLYQTLEKPGCENIASQIDQMTGLMLDKQADWFKGNKLANQTAIAVLEKLKKDFEFGNSVSGYGGWELSEITDYIDQQIKELKGEK